MIAGRIGTYVTRREWPGWDWSDPWHRWHEEGHHSRDSGQVHRSGEPERRGSDREVHQGESDGDDGPKGELPSGNVVSVHDKADKEEEKKLTGKPFEFLSPSV